MRPIDPRLARAAPVLRGYLVRLGVAGGAQAALLIAQATLIAQVVVRGFLDRSGLAGVRTDLAILAGVMTARALLGAWSARTAERASPRVMADLRAAMLRALAGPPAMGRAGGPVREGPSVGELAVTAGAGLDGMDAYLTRFLPALVSVAVVPPVLLVRLAFADWMSAAILAATLPLVPVFMALVGLATRARTDRQWAVLGRLSDHFLDVVEGLPTLKLFNRARAQVDTVRRVAERYRAETMTALRMAFLSSLVLELLATLSVALVAVSVGLRLVSGSVGARTALVVLLLAPEIYLPLRQVGTQYHATMSGLTAASAALDAVDTAERASPAAGRTPAPDTFDALRLDGVSLRHPGREAPALEGVSLTIRRGEVVALVGASGAGKTSLLALLRGEWIPTAGRVLVDGLALSEIDPVSWRAALAWLPQRPRAVSGGTVADEVRLGRPAAPDADVAAALALAAAPPGDRAVGPDGAALSAGERRRVALARVLVRDAPLVLLDEPTESLDAVTGHVVADAVAGLRGRSTVVLVTHSGAVAELADRVVRLDGGRIVADTPATAAAVLPAQGRSAFRAAAVSAAPAVAVAAEPAAPAGAAAPRGPGGEADAGGRGRGGRGRGRRGPGRRGPGRHRPGGLLRLGLLIRPAWPKLALGVLAGAAALGSGIGLTATAAWLISQAALHPPVLTLMVAATAVRALGLGKAVFRYAERLLSHDAALRALARLRPAVFARLIPLAPAGLVLFRRGDLLRRFTADTDGVGESLPRGVGPLLATGFVASGAAVGVGLLLPPAGLVLAAGLVAAAVLAGPVAARAAASAVAASAAARERRDGEIVAVLDALDELTAFGAVPARLAALADQDAEIVRLAGDPRRSPVWGNAAAATVAGLTALAVTALGVAGVRDGGLSGVLLAVIVLTTLAAFEPLAGLGDACVALRRASGEATRIFEVLDAEPPVTEPEPTRRRGLPAGPLGVRFDGVALRYGPGQPEVLRHFELAVPPGRRIALTGPSGAGKSTVAALVTRFVDPTRGRVLLGGVDLRDVASEDLYRSVGGMTQDAHVFDATLRENLMIARPGATETDLDHVLADVGLLAWMRGLPDGLDTRVGPRGGRLSGGQRQRLLLARALLADPAVLVLDEPTAHLDAATEQAVMHQIIDATRGRTVLLITHRDSGLDEMDAVVELAPDGRLALAPAAAAPAA